MTTRRALTTVLVTGVALAASATATVTAQAVPGPAPVALPPYYAELDLTGDGQVTPADLTVLGDALGASAGDPAWIPAADVDDDGVLTVSDLAAVAQRMVYDDGPFEIVEASVIDMQAAMNAGVTTSVELTREYLERIEAYDRVLVDPEGRPLNSIITTSDVALDAAAAADATRAASGMTSLLLGVPVAVKDNVNTADMATTGGCGCWEDNETGTDATIVSGLRADGAVVLAKASLDEFAFGFVSEFSTGQEPGSALLVASPYDTGRTAGGSSGGTGAAVSANLVGLGFGTDTGGSIRVPSSYNQLVGVRPTVGLVSRAGIIPLALSQDTAGPMARSVVDAAAALDAVVGVDPADPVTAGQEGKVPASYATSLDVDALDGARIGYVTSMVGSNATTTRLFAEATATLEALGASVVPLEAPAGFSAVLAEPSGSTNEFRHDLEDYVATSLAPQVEARTLEQIVATGHFVTSRQRTYESRAAVTEEMYEAWAGPEGSHTQALASGKVLLTSFMDELGLDALIYPTGTPYGTVGQNMRLSPNTGMPSVTVPMGQATEADATVPGAGVNLELLGRDYSEGALLGFAYAFEQATQARTTPTLYGPLG